MSRQVTIHSDGTGHGTVILDEDGNKLDRVTGLDLHIESNGVVEATIQVTHTSMNVQADIKEVSYQCPLCHDCIDHRCDEQIGGGQVASGHVARYDPQVTRLNPNRPMQIGNPRNNFNYIICGKKYNNNTCSAHSDTPHENHYDVITCVMWLEKP